MYNGWLEIVTNTSHPMVGLVMYKREWQSFQIKTTETRNACEVAWKFGLFLKKKKSNKL